MVVEWLGSLVGVDGEFSGELVVDEDVDVVAGLDGGGGGAGVSVPQGDGVGAGNLDSSVPVDGVVVDAGGLARCCGGWSDGGGVGEHFCGDSASEAAMRPLVVIDDEKPVEVVLELFDGGGVGLGSEEPFQGLVEPFDFAAGLGVIGAGMPGLDR